MTIQEIASASALLKKELAPLAEKLGKGAEYTFGLFVKQVYVNALIKLLWLPPGILAMYFGWKWTKELWKTDDEDIAIFTVILFIAGLMMILIPLTGLIPAFVNPEYQAIKLILQTIKGN